jgi:O-antigen/teichoic acid export membrane protein
MGFAGGVLGINFFAILLTQVDKILLSRLLSLEFFGYYVLAATLAGGIYLMINPITQAFYPRMVEHAAHKDTLGFAHIYHQGAQLVTLVTAPVMAILFIYPEGVLYLWSGDLALAERTAPILAPLALGSFLNGLMWMPYQCQLAHGWTSLAFKANILAATILVPAVLWLVPTYGVIAAAWLWVALNLGYVLIPLHFMHKHLVLGEKMRWYIEDTLKPTLAGIGVAWFFRDWILPNAQIGRWAWALYLALSGMAVFGVTLLMLNRIQPLVRTEIARIVEGRMSRNRR